MSVKQQVSASIHPTVNAVSICNQNSQKVVNGATSGLRYRLSLQIAIIRWAVISDNIPPQRHQSRSDVGRGAGHSIWCGFNDTLLVGRKAVKSIEKFLRCALAHRYPISSLLVWSQLLSSFSEHTPSSLEIKYNEASRLCNCKSLVTFCVPDMAWIRVKYKLLPE